MHAIHLAEPVAVFTTYSAYLYSGIFRSTIERMGHKGLFQFPTHGSASFLAAFPNVVLEQTENKGVI